jgi:hypothetical protein
MGDRWTLSAPLSRSRLGLGQGGRATPLRKSIGRLATKTFSPGRSEIIAAPEPPEDLVGHSAPSFHAIQYSPS